MIKSFLSSMTARIFIILALGSVLSAAMVILLATYERGDLEERIRIGHTAERVGQIIMMLDAVPATSRNAVVNVAEKYGIKVNLNDTTVVIDDYPATEFSRALKKTLGEDKAVTVLTHNNQDCAVRQSDHDKNLMQSRKCETVLTTLKDSTPVRLEVTHRLRTPMPFQRGFLTDLALYFLGIILIALCVAHMATKPLRLLARAAEDLGVNIEHPPLSENKGSTEVRKASAAFNRMQASIRNHIRERTFMLAAIAHDLQTPLTRLRLRLEKVKDDDLRVSLIGDMTATLAMVKEGLEFARVTNTDEPFSRVDIDSLMGAICDDAVDAGAQVTCQGRIGKPVLANIHSLRRCIMNLIDNALKYGKSSQIVLSLENSQAIIRVIDAGPGLPEEQLQTVFEPFNRFESSRSRNSGGTGLGLTIARILAEKHHGTIVLNNLAAPASGLVATLSLPVA